MTAQRALCAAAVTLVVGLAGGPGVGSAGAATPNFTWTGQAGTELWSSAGNWQGGVAPSGTVGTLSFPALACAPTTLCESETDVANVSATALNLDDASGYAIAPLTASDSAEALAIGSGGLTATTRARSAPNGTPVLGPVSFSGAETWTIDGGPAGVGGLTLGQISSASSGAGTLHPTAPSLALHLADQAQLNLAGAGVDNELGTLTVTGSNTSDTGAAASANGTIDFTASGGELNAEDLTPVTLDDAALVGAGTVGPLSASGSLIGFTSSVGTTQIDGNANLGGGTLLDLPLVGSGSATPAGSDYAQLNATGQVALNGVTLKLVPDTPRCPSLAAGDVDAIVTAVGGVSGTFTGMPNGAQVTLNCVGQAPSLRIGYTTNTVTATVLSAGGPAYPTSVALTGPTSTPIAGQTMALSATVASSHAAAGTEPAGSLTFFEDRTAIPGCGSEALSASGSGVGAGCSLTAPSGAHNFTATYTPSTTDWAAATSSAVSITPTPVLAPTASPTVTPPAPTPTSSVPAPAAPLLSPVMKLSAGRAPGNPQLLSDTATLTPPSRHAPALSGQVSFFDGAVAIPGCQAVALSAGAASCTTGVQTLGAQTLTAVFAATSTYSAATAHAVAYSSLAAPTARFTRFSTQTPALSLTVRSPEAPFTGYTVAFLTPGISFDAFAALMSSSGKLRMAHSALALTLASPAASAYFQLGTGAVKLTHSLPAHGAIQTLVSLTFAHRPSAELLLSIPR